MSASWQVWVDTGGTFTDCAAVDPEGELRRAKVLSSSALRGRLRPRVDRVVRFDCGVELPDGFFAGGTLRSLQGAASRIRSSGRDGVLELAEPLTGLEDGISGEVAFDEPAPVLAARIVTRTAAGEPMPRMVLRLATTRGTNALLERRGGRVALFVTAGFADLLVIGTQQRPDLFALEIERPEPLYERVVEVEERLGADGSVVRELDLEGLRPLAERLRRDGIDCAAVALMHAYRNPEHERRVASLLREVGFDHVSASSELAGRVQILPRAETAVVNAYLAPVVGDYLTRVQQAIGGGTLLVMTSAGGLVGAADYRPKDSLLSGPAGGVIGAAAAGRAAGARRIVAFDMGGTSTDVSRVGERLDYRHTTQVGGARLMAPALAIETVAAGGGSICWFDGTQVRVGPQSAGAAPGPASYGAGGPLTLTDVNLLLGRIDAASFVIPLDVEAARSAAADLATAVRRGSGEEVGEESLLAGLLAIADERMAEAIRRISIRRGYAVGDHALVAFGGAGGQHACALAEILGVERVVVPADAGILSALGLGAARLERFAEKSVLAPLDDVAERLAGWFGELADRAEAAVVAEGASEDEVEVTRRTVELRVAGQAASLTVEWDPEVDPAAAFTRRYRDLYGYAPPDAAVEVESLRLVAAAGELPGLPSAPEPAERPGGDLEVRQRRRVWVDGAWGEHPYASRSELRPGDRLAGPALVGEAHSATVVGAAWRASVHACGALVLERVEG